MLNIFDFTNDNFRILKFLYDNMDENCLVKVTQQEVGEATCISHVTVNKIFQCLKKELCIRQDKTRVGRYYVLDNGKYIVESFLSIERK